MGSKLKASVVISTWNRRELLEKQLESLINQTVEMSEYEIIVCDSGSTDGTKAAVSSLAACHENIRYVEVPVNNPAAKRNKGIRSARADIVILMDDDV